jgi:hypothetical protein
MLMLARRESSVKRNPPGAIEEATVTTCRERQCCDSFMREEIC